MATNATPHMSEHIGLTPIDTPGVGRPGPHSTPAGRGMALILVVAILVLLALMGTVYLVVANADRQSLGASNTSLSLHFAQQGMMNIVCGIMLDQTLDQNNRALSIGQFNTVTGTPDPDYGAGFIPDQSTIWATAGGTITGRISRLWDFPEIGGVRTASGPPETSPTAMQQFYRSTLVVGESLASGAVQWTASEPWLVSDPAYEPLARYTPGQEVFFCDPNPDTPLASPVPVANRTMHLYVYTGPVNAVNPGAPDAIGTTFWTPAPLPHAPLPVDTSVPFAASGTTNNGGLVPMVSMLSPYLFDPNSGNMDIGYSDGRSTRVPLAGTGGNVIVPNASVTAPRWLPDFAAAPGRDGPLLVKPPGTTNAALTCGPDAIWNLLPYSDPNGTRYRFAVRIIDLSSRLNVNTGYIRYPYTNTAKNAGQQPNDYARFGTFATSAPILNLPGFNIAPSDDAAATRTGTPVQTGSGRAFGNIPGRMGTYAAGSYTLPFWQAAMNQAEIGYPTIRAGGTRSLCLYSSASELDLLTAGGTGGMPFGNPLISRIARLMPATFGLCANGYGAGYRSLYTTDSWTRTLAPVRIPGVAVAPQNAPGLMAVGPAKVDLNAPVADMAAVANQLYETLRLCGYTEPHAAAFVANYAAYRFGNGPLPGQFGSMAMAPPTIRYFAAPANAANGWPSPPGEYLSIPALGIYATSTTPGIFLSAMTNDQNTYCGMTAQPFLNELEVRLTTNGNGGSAFNAGAVISAWSLELMNPFPTAGPLNLRGWQIVMNGAIVVPNLGALAGGGTPPGTIGSYQNPTRQGGPFAVIYSGVGAPKSVGINTPFLISTVSYPVALRGTVELRRPIAVTGGAMQYAVVDSMRYDFSRLRYQPDIAIWYADLQRDNIRQPEWGCDCAAQTLATPRGAAVPEPSTTPFQNLGLANNAIVTGNPGVPLFDRIAAGESEIAPGSPLDANSDLFNIDDFNCIARESNYRITIGPDTGARTLSAQIAFNVAPTAPTTNYSPAATLDCNNGMYYVATAAGAPFHASVLPVDASAGNISNEAFQAALYFDFAYDPRAAFTVADQSFPDPVLTPDGISPTATPNSAGRNEMPPTVLALTTLLGRNMPNPAAKGLPRGATDLVRLPGRININTANPAVLYSTLSNDGALWNGNAPPAAASVRQLAADAIAMRDRLGSANLAIFSASRSIATPAYNGFSGIGYHSTADLLVAFIPTVESGTFPTGGTYMPATIQQRDAAWADIENFISVRSDTFAVYGLIQALRLNPAYVTMARSATTAYAPVDWYNANQGITPGRTATRDSLTMNQHDPNAEFILESSRRFIAIIDRSYCNAGSQIQPHLVALEPLP